MLSPTIAAWSDKIVVVTSTVMASSELRNWPVYSLLGI